MSTSSYRKINYTVRPAKAVQRHLIMDVMQLWAKRLLFHVSEFRYVGLGSPYFVDFKLMHRRFGITDLVSIEGELDDAGRFRFNVPFACVDLRLGWTSDVLPDLDWSRPTLVWLDYDLKLHEFMLADVEFLAGELAPGSLLLVTVDADPKAMERRVERSQEFLPESWPPGVTDEDLGGEGLAILSRRLLDDAWRNGLASRNAGRSASQVALSAPLLNVTYADGARMCTVGWTVGSSAIDPAVGDLGSLEFLRVGPIPFEIAVPNLTLREVQYLEQLLPCEPSVRDMEEIGLPAEELELFQQLYRWLPTYVDVDV